MTPQHEIYGLGGRERDLLRDGVDLAVPKLVMARQLLAAISNSWEADELVRRAIHDITVGMD